ncbi:MAG: hypothetical protein RLZZ297_1789 [Chloroflexota bacterium]
MSRLAEIARRIDACRACALCTSATHAVPGEGPADAAVMLVGEAPGAAEDRSGRPFVGASGRVLDGLLQRAGLSRGQVFIANVVKHRPPENRDPTPVEIHACRPFLEQQIAVIAPLVIVPLGRHAARHWLPDIRIGSDHGVPQRVADRLIVPMLHPAAGLYQPRNMPLLQADFERLGVLLREGVAGGARTDRENDHGISTQS